MENLLNTTPATKIIYDKSKVLFGDNVKQGDPLSTILCVISGLVDELFKNDLLDCIDLDKLGIKCPDKNVSRQCVIMNWMSDNILTTNQSITKLLQNVQILQQGIGVLKDEKVKVKPAGTAKYLEDILKAPAGVLTFANDTVTFGGFVPIGFRATISKSRLGDFDATGKGKPDTDLWGWAIRNGQNGLPNHMGMFSRNAAVLVDGDTIAGADSFTVSKQNIASFSIPVSGVITEALENNVTFKIDITNNINGGPRRNGFATNHTGAVDEFQTKPANFKHTHSFALNVAHTNINPVPIDLIPKHIKEIPIQRIIP